MNTLRIAIENTAIRQLDVNLIRSHAKDGKPLLYRFSATDGHYFVDDSEFEGEVIDKLKKIPAGTPIRVAIRQDRGRRKMAWLRSADHIVAPRDAQARRRKHWALLFKTTCWMVACLAAIAIPNFFVQALAILAAVIFGLGSALSIISLVMSVLDGDMEAQSTWLREPMKWKVDGAGR